MEEKERKGETLISTVDDELSPQSRGSFFACVSCTLRFFAEFLCVCVFINSCVCVSSVFGRFRCLICQCDFEVGEELRRLPCNHTFHSGEYNANTTDNNGRN